MRPQTLLLALSILGCAAFAAAAVSSSGHANNLQGDVTCDDQIAVDDLTSILRAQAELDYDAPCLSIAGDANCDGVVDELDALWLAASVADIPNEPPGHCERVGATLPAADDRLDAAVIDLEVTPRLQCNSEVPFHEITAQWEITGIAPPVGVAVKALYSWGASDSAASTELTGSVQFQEPDVGPGFVVVRLEALTAANQLSVVEENVQLDTCIPTPATPAPGDGFVVLATPGPPEFPLTGPAGDINETDIAHIGGSPQGPTQDVTAVTIGTGAAWRLLSYGTDGTLPLPEGLDETRNFAGRDIKLIALEPGLSPSLTLNILVAAYIHEGNLWLSTWQLDADGDFTPLDKRGFGANLGITVEKYGIAQRPVPAGYQVVTPIIGTQAQPQGAANPDGVRMVTWSVNAATGAINGLQAGPGFGGPHEDAQLAIAPLEGDNVTPGGYVLSYRNTNEIMETQFWSVSNSGEPLLRGLSASGYSRDGSATIAEEVSHLTVLPLTDGGFFSPQVDGGGSLTVSTWEARLDFCFFGACFAAPYRISDDTVDMDFGPGITLPLANQPSLTDGQNDKVAGGEVQTVRAILSESGWEETLGVGDGEMYSEFPAGEFISVGIGSVTKNMTLRLAAKATNAGDVSLADPVTISEAAAGVGGSQVGFLEDEVFTLEDLLYGMMLVSGNDASLAIAEHVGGSEAGFVEMMQAEADALGLTDTSYNQPAGGGYSTPQDQVTLWRQSWKIALFRQFASSTDWDGCGTDSFGGEVCYPLAKGAGGGYPGQQGWKGGSVGFHDSEKAALGVPLCTRCLVVQASRLGRTLIVGLQQSGDRWADSTDLFEYGYLTLFTPDRVASLGQIGVSQDFAIDSIGDSLAIVSRIDSGELFICTFSMFADGGDLSQNGCVSPRLANMPAGAAVPRTFVDAVRFSTLQYEGDYLTAYWLAGHVHLGMWRVGPKEP